ncbi:MAG: hypothetical protein WD733_24650 [Bryobacterales bacterium]
MTELKSLRCLVFLVTLSFLSALVPVCPAEDLEFSFPEKSVSFPAEIAAGMAIPRWIHGRMVSVWGHLDYRDPRANVHVYDSNGRKIYEARVWPPQATRVSLLDMAVSRDGDVAVVGVANDSSGQPAYFFAHIAPSGKVSPPVRIQPFEGQRATFGPDGTLWILGWELDHLRRFDPSADHATLRQFALDGKVLGEFLPRSSFGCPAPQHPALGIRGGRPELLASRDRIIVLSGFCGQVIELTPEGEILRRVSVPDEELLPPFAAAVTSDNVVYIKRHPTSPMCRLQLYDGSCVDIQSAGKYTLIGAEGEALVLQNGSALEWRRAVE